MPFYKAPVDHALFLLNDVFAVRRHAALPRFAAADPDTLAAVLREAARFSETVLLPLNMVGDRQGCTREPCGGVRSPDGFAEAYRQFAAGGWMGVSSDPDHGGQGLPQVLALLVNEFCTSANMAFTMFPGLTRSAVAALLAHGTPAQKATYVPRLVSGEWLGTMNLTEPQCGTDLGLLRTVARPQPDGSYRVTGQKIYISGGEHDLTPNIIHLVLARMPGAPAGAKGLSLFLVPKRLVEADGSLGARNAVTCAGLERKMGIHASPTCTMNYEDATGFLVGEPNRGLNAMFVMMNEARLGVANQGLALSEVAYQNAAAFARERLQGRALGGAADASRPADPIIVHPDVRRALLSIRAFNEAARALLVSTILDAEAASLAGDPAAAEAAADRLGLLTPVLKGVLTDTGFDNCVLAQQVLGGQGYAAGSGVEQFVRDSRVAMIYEGANGIQALDLVGRKLPRHGGRAFTAYAAELGRVLARAGTVAELGFCVEPMRKAAEALQRATLWFLGHAVADPDHAGAGSTDYMHLFGLVALGHMWVLMAEAALAGRAAGRGEAVGTDTKLTLARVFMERLLPGTAVRLARITAGADAVMAMPAEAF